MESGAARKRLTLGLELASQELIDGLSEH